MRESARITPSMLATAADAIVRPFVKIRIYAPVVNADRIATLPRWRALPSTPRRRRLPKSVAVVAIVANSARILQFAGASSHT